MKKGKKKKSGRLFSVLTGICAVTMTVVIAIAYVRGGQQEETVVAEIAQATLPTISMTYGGQTINCLQGYTTPMDLTQMDTVLAPITDSKQLPVTVRLFDNRLTAVDCLIYREAGADPIEQRHTDNPTVVETDGERTAQLTVDLSNAITSGEEYLLELRLTVGTNRIVYYYMRVAADQEDRTIDTAEALAFARDFCNNTFDAGASEEVAKYLETDTVSSDTAYAHVDLHDETTQVTWGTLGAAQYGEPVVDLLELDDSGALLSIDYQVTVPEDEETNSYYLVHEYYRVYKNETRMCLMEFDRTVTETFVGTQLVVSGQSLLLGTLPDDVEYVFSNDEKIVVWEQAGELWEYDTDGGNLYKIFTLQDTMQGDKRAYMQNYDIHILRVSNNGNTDFVVSGYANRGAYEGTSGMQLYRYTQRSNTYETLYAVTDDRDPALVRADISRLSYLSGKDFYYYLCGTLWHANLDKDTVEALETDLSADMLVASDSGRYVTWAADPDASTSLVCMDLKKNKQYTIDAGEDEYIRPIGYVNNDLAYGKAKTSAVTESGTGSVYFPMYTVVICDSSGDTIKEYTDETIPVTGGTTTDELITLTRVTAAEDGGYTETQPHQIVNAQEEDEDEEAPLTTTYSDARGQQTVLNLPVACADELHRYTAETSAKASVSAEEVAPVGSTSSGTSSASNSTTSSSDASASAEASSSSAEAELVEEASAVASASSGSSSASTSSGASSASNSMTSASDASASAEGSSGSAKADPVEETSSEDSVSSTSSDSSETSSGASSGATSSVSSHTTDGVATSAAFYVYDERGLVGCYRDSRAAFIAAQADGCRLKDGTMRTLYYRKASVTAAKSKAPDFDPATADGDIVSAWQAQETEKTVADATGISFEMLLRMVGQGASALVKTGAGQYRYLTAYTQSTVTFTDAGTGQTEQKSLADAQALYEKFGCVCVLCK